MQVTRNQVLDYRAATQQLQRIGSHGHEDTALLDIGVQDTGTDGADWALRIRGARPTDDSLALAWTLRGAPHFYRRDEIAQVGAATAPFSDADAGKRIFDAAKPLRAAGISPLTALDVIAEEMRDLVTTPTVKGDVSGGLRQRLDEPYLRECKPCKAIHAYEQPFRLAALRAGLELQPGTSPPVLERIPGWSGAAARVPERLDVIRACLHLLGPATPQLVAGYLDAAVADVKARWPQDTVEVSLDGERRWILEDDAESLQDAAVDGKAVRLLAAYDLFLQARDRELLVPDADRRKALWVVLGRPGAILRGGALVGMWRARSVKGRLTVSTELWSRVARSALEEQAERLADHRGLALAAVT